ncbi:MAG: T9SS type A sorting domain-containing protein [Ignavibacteria bacterium]|nr:T9SS type A sorting domain-containing protein [Ignavibacteria bacterium]
MKKFTSPANSDNRVKTSVAVNNAGAMLFLLFFVTFATIPVKADFVGVSGTNIIVYQSNTWIPVSTKSLTLTDFTINGSTAVTWNSDDLKFYAIVTTTTNTYRLVTVEPSTGVCTDKGNMGGFFGSLTYSSTTGILYAMGGTSAPYQKIYSVNINNGATTFLGGPYPGIEEEGGIIAYNYTNNFIYCWTGLFFPTLSKINTSTFVEEFVGTGGPAGGVYGAVYIGGGNFIISAGNVYTVDISGAWSLLANNVSSRGLGYVDPLLPVELSSFTSSVNGRNVELNWTTSAETNNSGFEIERSNDRGQTSNEWIEVGNVNGNGTTTSSSNYSFTDRGLSSGNYNYRLKQIDFNGNFVYFNLSNEVNVGVPAKFDLSQNYPNPFNPSTQINYDLPLDGNVSIKLFDMSGKEVAALVNEVKTAGYYTVNFNAGNLSSGIYFYTIKANNFVQTKKMMLLK